MATPDQKDTRQNPPEPARTPGIPGEVPGIDTGDTAKRIDQAPVKPLTDPKDTKGG